MVRRQAPVTRFQTRSLRSREREKPRPGESSRAYDSTAMTSEGELREGLRDEEPGAAMRLEEKEGRSEVKVER